MRLIGASDGATEAQVAFALSLESDRGLDAGTAPAALALATREGKDTEPFETFIRDAFDQDAEKILVFADATTLRDPSVPLDSRLEGLHLEARCAAMTIAAIVLGEDLPKAWRDAVMAMMFSAERPFFAPRADAPDDEPEVP